MSLDISSSHIPEPLSGKFKDSFAYKTLAHRIPVIITKVIDFICRQRKKLPIHLSIEATNLVAAEEETKELIEELARLKYELQTNKPLNELKSSLSDTQIWNDYLREHAQVAGGADKVLWFNVSWLYAECYVYRRMREVFVNSNHYREFDPFYANKQEAWFDSQQFAHLLAVNLLGVNASKQPNEEQFYFYTMTSLWGNKCDLSLSCGEKNNSFDTDFRSLQSKIIVNDYDALWNHVKTLSNQAGQYRIDVVLDNAGYELFTDLCFIEFMHQVQLLPKKRTTVYFHVKKMPWFVSDVMVKDVHWLLNIIQTGENTTDKLKDVAHLFQYNITAGIWIVQEHDFWTLPHDFSQMSTIAPDLYDQLCQSHLVIFKGDLNYRKLVGDLRWPLQTTFLRSLRQFKPTTAICSLRTIKADVVVGVLEPAKIEHIQSTFPVDWMEIGEYAVLHFLVNQ